MVVVVIVISRGEKVKGGRGVSSRTKKNERRPASMMTPTPNANDVRLLIGEQREILESKS